MKKKKLKLEIKSLKKTKGSLNAPLKIPNIKD